MLVVLTTIVILIILIIRRLYHDADIEAIRTSRVTIVGYIPDEGYRNAIVECKAMNGRIIRLIDKGMKLQNDMVIQFTEPVWIRYHIEQSWLVFFNLDIYIDGFDLDDPSDKI